MTKQSLDLIAQALETIVNGIALDPMDKALVLIGIQSIRDHVVAHSDAPAKPKAPTKPKAAKVKADTNA